MSVQLILCNFFMKILSCSKIVYLGCIICNVVQLQCSTRIETSEVITSGTFSNQDWWETRRVVPVPDILWSEICTPLKYIKSGRLTHFSWWRSSLRTSAPRRGRKLITNISKQYTIIFWWKKIGNASNRASTRWSSRGINWRARVNKAWKMEAYFSSALKETPLREKNLYSSPIYLNIFSRTFAKGN